MIHRADKWVAHSHERQFAGEDYQKVGVEIADRLGLDPEVDEERVNELHSAPCPDCLCGFCESAPFDTGGAR